MMKKRKGYLDGKAHFHNIYFTFYCHYFFFHSSYIWWSYKKQILDWMELDPFYQNLWNTGRYIFISSAVFLVFIILYRFIPSRRMRLTEVVPGSVFATLGWLLTSLGFAYYVDNFSNYSRFYGSIGGVVILLIWLYYSAVIILLGGELNAALAYEKKLNNKRESK